MRPVFIIAEAGVNHNGCVSTAKKLVDAALLAGADAVKFQTFVTDNIISKNTSLAEYQGKNVHGVKSQYEMIKDLELSFDDFKDIKKYCDEVGIEFLSTPDDSESLEFLIDKLDMKKIKIGSAEVTNLPFLKEIASKNKPIILSTGMSSLNEVAKAVDTIRSVSSAKLTILHCTTNYPCPIDEVNLLAMQTLKNKFDVEVGYSDHTLGTDISIAAVALGARLIEKHLTLNTQDAGPDHKASLSIEDFKIMVDKIRDVEKAMGDGIKKPTKSEKNIIPVVRKRIFSKNRILHGQVITEQDITYKRGNYGLYVEQYMELIGKVSIKDIDINQPLDFSHIET